MKRKKVAVAKIRPMTDRRGRIMKFPETSMETDATRLMEGSCVHLDSLPIGAKVTIEYPRCPDCKSVRTDTLHTLADGSHLIENDSVCQECGYNWNDWAEESVV